MADFEINTALKYYLDDPNTIPVPNAEINLTECEDEALEFDQVIEILHPIVDAISENPENIKQAGYLDSLQFLLQRSSFLHQKIVVQIFESIIGSLATEAEHIHHEEQEGDIDVGRAKQMLEIYGFLLQWCIAAVEAKAIEKSPAPLARSKSSKSAKSKTPKDESWDSSGQLQAALDTMSRVMKLKLSKIFVTTSERDTFIGLFTRPTYLILENESRTKSTAIRMHAFKVICIAVKHHGHAYSAQTSIIQNLTYFEHLAEPMAELLNILSEQYDYPQLAEDVMKDLSGKEFSASDTRGPKSVSAFVARLSELAPRVVQRQVSYLAKLLESENYTLRCAIIEVCGNLISMLSRMEEGDRSENHKAQINAFFDVLEDRLLDVNPYCRCRALQVFAKLCDLETKYPKRRQTAAELARRALEDKSSNVRRNAVKLLARLLATHPFSLLHGGRLNQTEWVGRLESCEADLNALQSASTISRSAENAESEQTIDESLIDGPTQMDGEDNGATVMTDEQKLAALEKAQQDAANAEAMNKLQLTRRYYIEAIRFIETLHSASAGIIQLLGSKNKNEVIDSMDFFVVSDAYHLETAKTGIRRMLRLIWTKGNSDEGKGVQSHLIECYKGLFFDAPDHFSANDAANYIARNMISLTFGATPAELTSLEQLLATMIKEDNVASLVIHKLWQVYGVQRKEISRQQRRGAIIVLGMLALADPEIIVNEMETCLRIGLGGIGCKDLVLARYTCVALMRMTNDTSTKGAQAKPSMRMPNDHAVSNCLANLLAIEHDSPEWYGMAEKAIGAIYALSKHPDVLCSEIIRRRTKMVFASQQLSSAQHVQDDSQIDDDGDVEMSGIQHSKADDSKLPAEVAAPDKLEQQMSRTVGLSQLLFLVGHVALKQIVHLELCEKDFKRRRAEKEKEREKDRGKVTSATAGSGKRPSPSQNRIASNEAEADDELDLMAGTNEDDFADAIAHIRERELLYGSQSLLANYGALVREICSNNTSYPDSELQAQAALCLAKFMCVSSEFCEANLGLLITILERSPSPIVRSNLVVALGDMAVCFNHLIDENTDFLYRRLSDTSLTVKRTCLMTLTFLILAGQVKVKGQLGDMAKCVEDTDDRIREMSRMFFWELAGKDNAVYNHFVDMFSLLSSDTELEEEKFRKIIRFLASFIEKDKHAKQLAGKLAPRLAKVETERQWNDIAFAINLLPHKNEEIAKIIAEGCKFVENPVA